MGDAETGNTEAKTSKARSDEFVEERPLPPDSPVAKIRAFTKAHQDGLITYDELIAAVQRLQRRAMEEGGYEPI